MTRPALALFAAALAVAPAAAQPPAKPLGTEYAAPDYGMAVTADPNRLTQVAKAVGLPVDELWAFIKARTTVDPTTVDRVTVLIEPFPAGNLAFMPVGVLRFTAPADPAAKLKAMLGGSVVSGRAGKQSYSASKTLKVAGVAVAGFTAADGTVVVGVEPMIAALPTAAAKPRPLADALAAADTDHDAVIVLAGKPVRDRVAAAFGRVKLLRLPPAVRAGMLSLDTATATVDLTADPVVRAEFRSTGGADGAKAVRGLVEFVLGETKAAYPDARKVIEAGLPAEGKGPALLLLDAVVNDVTLTTDGATVVMTVPRPKRLVIPK